MDSRVIVSLYSLSLSFCLTLTCSLFFQVCVRRRHFNSCSAERKVRVLALMRPPGAFSRGPEGPAPTLKDWSSLLMERKTHSALFHQILAKVQVGNNRETEPQKAPQQDIPGENKILLMNENSTVHLFTYAFVNLTESLMLFHQKVLDALATTLIV